ncbi:rhomboid family intramembrane serine protease [Aestuariibius sp. 2305UL40-4]|uniref:rhomboid family intramembrane serine protease n=1 Tax=Aestuariibius violaceus TaxID=3234132 RepID=UPI00345E8112
MFPIRDHNPSQNVPWVTYGLIAANILIFLSYAGLFNDPPRLNALFWDWALIPARVSEGEALSGFLTSIFLHGGVMHLAGNMLFLWVFGDNLEDEMGALGFLIFYLACGVAAGLAQYLAEPFTPIPMVGASGAIAGVMGGYLLLFPRAKVDILFIFIVIFRIIPVPAWIMLALWFGLQVLRGVGADTGSGGVAYWAHAGGFVIGALLAIPLWLRLGGPRFWVRTHGHPPHPDATYRRSSVPVVRKR